MSVLLCEDNIPGSSLAGRNPAELKTEELRVWLKCRNNSGKGLRIRVFNLWSGKQLNYSSDRTGPWMFILFTLEKNVREKQSALLLLTVPMSCRLCYGRVNGWVRDVCMSHQSDRIYYEEPIKFLVVKVNGMWEDLIPIEFGTAIFILL